MAGRLDEPSAETEEREPTTAVVGVEGDESDRPEYPAPSEGEGLARTARGRLVITVFLVVTLAAILVANMPKSQTKADLLPWTQPYLEAVGLDQNWGVFSPDPRHDTSHILARIEYTDGTVAERTIDASAGIAEYRDYRWRKYEEQLWSARDASRNWLPYARWVTAQDRDEGKRARTVTIIRRTRDSLPPGPGPDYGPWRDIVLGTVTGR